MNQMYCANCCDDVVPDRYSCCPACGSRLNPEARRPADGPSAAEVTAEADETRGRLCLAQKRQGCLTGARVTVESGSIIGRRSDEKAVDIDLSRFGDLSSTVSRRHARVWQEQGSWWIEDLDSTYGSFVNGERLGQGRRELHDGDTLGLGDMLFFVNLTMKEALENG